MSKILVRCGAAFALVVACGSSDNPSGDPADAGIIDQADAGFTDSSPSCGDTARDPKNCGACGAACAADQVCAEGKCACPLYQTFCGGKCVPTADDPSHCGACDIQCTGNLACSGGECSATCLPGLQICGNRCVDPRTDSANCGGCGTTCAPGKGCVAGNCEAAIPLGPAPAKCVGSGPPIVNTPDQGGCLGGLAQTTFRWALCSCKDVAFTAAVLTDAYDSAKGPYKPGGLGGGIGANDKHNASGRADVGGDLWVHGPTGVQPAAVHTIKHDLKVGGPLGSSAPVTVGADAWVDGNVSTSSSISIAGTLHVPQSTTIQGGVTSAAVDRAPVAFAPPCDCAPNQIVPIAAIVAAHAGSNNDNAAVGLDANALATPSGPIRLDLPCGEYYFTGVNTTHPIAIVAHGRTAVYIAGDLTSSADIAFAVDSIGELDIFISGALGTSALLAVGSPSTPALSRTYVGSSSGLSLSASSRIGGNLYAANGLVTWSGGSDIYGSLFGGDFKASAATSIHYDRAILHTGDSCPPSGSGGEAGSSACGSCLDCGNQACINGKCGECGSSADCCAPLVCASGRCIPAIK